MQPADIDFDFETDEDRQEEMNRYIEKLKESVKLLIQKFFANKSFYCGGSIPGKKLLSDSSINLVLSTPFCAGVEECYAAMARSSNYLNGSDDVYSFLKVLTEARKAGVPKKLQAGIVLLYYRFCEGLQIADKPLNISHLYEW